MEDFRHLPLSDYLVFGNVMREPALCQHFLEKVLDIKIRKIVFLEKEVDLSDSAIFHGIQLDVYVEDDANSVYDVEMQNTVESMRRVRYYQSVIDRRILEKGEHYSKLKTSFIIVICNYDPSRAPRDRSNPESREVPGLAYPMYKRESVLACPVGTAVYEDGSHAIFLNTKYHPKYRQEMPEVCEFLDLMNETRNVPPESLQYPLARMAAEEITRFRKKEEKGGSIMTVKEYVQDEIYKARMKGEEIGEARGEKRGEARAREKFVQRLMKVQNLSREEAEKILS